MSQLRRIRWSVRAVLVLGVAASVAANILHARPNPVSQVIAAWPPLALLLTVELISRIPVHRRSLAAVRLLATSTIAGIAAWVSYWHMAGVAARYGEDSVSAHLLPLSVDGLVIVASVSLVELAGRIRQLEAPVATTAPAVAVAAAVVEPPLVAVAPVAAVEPPHDNRPVAHGLEAATAAATPPRARSRMRRPAAETRRLAAELQAAEPGLQPKDLAARLDLSPRRMREVLAAPEPRAAADGRTPQLQPA